MIREQTECAAYNCADFADREVDGAAYCERHARLEENYDKLRHGRVHEMHTTRRRTARRDE